VKLADIPYGSATVGHARCFVGAVSSLTLDFFYHVLTYFGMEGVTLICRNSQEE